MTVVCLGDVMTDVVAQLSGPLAPGSDTPAPVVVRGGGSAANTACWLASLGVAVTFAGRVGADPAGRILMDELTAAGINLDVTVDQARRTGTCIVLVHPDGERTMVPDAGANAGLSAADAPILDDGTDWLHVSGYPLLHGATAGVLVTMSRARERGLSVSVDAASAAPLEGFGAQRFLDLIGTDILLLANTAEAHVLTGCAHPEQACVRLGRRVGRCVVKCGRAGAIWSTGDDALRVRAEAVPVIDSTGAGDAFAAGLIAALLDGAGPRRALTQGHQVAARALLGIGGRPDRRGRDNAKTEG